MMASLSIQDMQLSRQGEVHNLQSRHADTADSIRATTPVHEIH
jgi:hypothetical protein